MNWWPFKFGRSATQADASPPAPAPVATPGLPLDSDSPVSIDGLKGFEASVTRKDGVLLTYQVRPEGAEGPHEAGSAPYYYEVSVRPTGEDPEYPAQEEPTVYQFTNSLGGTSGFNGGVIFGSADQQYAGFSLKEEFDDGSLKPGFMGHRMPAHHSVMLSAHFVAADGREGSSSVGSWIRKSERESEAWKSARQSRGMYI